MRRTFDKKIDIVDALEHAKVQIRFLADACASLCRKEDPIGDDSAFGMQLIFDSLYDQIDGLSEEIQENVYEVQETEGVIPAVRKEKYVKHKNAPESI